MTVKESFDNIAPKAESQHSKPHLQGYLNSTIKFNDNKTIDAVKYGHAVLAGFETPQFATNLTNCYDGFASFVLDDIQHIQIAYLYSDTDDAVFNTTRVIGRLAQKTKTCLSFFQGFYYFYYDQADAYEDAAAFFISFFQNILANVLNINTIYQAMQADLTKTKNITDVYFQAGRIAHIIFDIKPVVPTTMKLKQEVSEEPHERIRTNYHDHILSH